MNRKLNAAITAGLSLSMVLSSTPVAAIAAETTQNTSEGATAAASTGVKTVTFVAENGGGAFADGSIVMRIQTNDKGVCSMPESPVRDGYVFGGWYYDNTCTHAVDFSQPLLSDASNFVVLFAKWTEAPSNVLDVTYSANGGQFADGNNVMLGKTDSNGIARQPLAPTRDGYVFAGWYYHSDGTDQVDFNQPIVDGGDHVTLFAAWTPVKQDKSVEILYVANGGTFFDGNETMQGVTDTDGIARLPLQPTREGYDFLGWSYDRDGNDPVDFTKAIVAGSGHATVYAQWKQNNEKTVLYVANGGVFADGNETMEGVTDSDGVARQPLAPTREGYTFAGWTYDREGTDPVDFDNPLVGGGKHATLYAQWNAVEEDNSIDVLYVANGGTFFDGSDALQGVTDGDGVARQPLAPTREGYTFAGWTYDAAGTDPVDFSKPVQGGGDHVTFYAQWTEDKATDENVKDVLYFANGGVFFDGNETLQGVTDGDGVARQPLAPTREGYTFAGWTYDAAGTDPVDFSKPVQGGGDHVTFYAQWTKNETPAVETHKVNFYVDGSTTTVEVEDGKTVDQPNDPSVDGFDFVGWSSSKESFKKFDFSTPITEDTTVYAFFTAKTPKSETLKKDDEGKKQVAADKKDEAKAEKKDDAALASTGDPTFVVTSAAALTGAVAVAVGMYMTKRREH